MSIYKSLGIMSGTSLDAVDLAYCIFDKKQGVWEYEIIKSISVEYDAKWRNKLANAPKLSAEELVKLDFEYGHYLGKLCAAFIQRQNLSPDLIASHGHTVFHNPTDGYTLQIGNISAIAPYVNCKVVNDFRSQDIALGGQGAPLVPIGDKLLFADYTACVNLGGIANISLQKNLKRIAWDIGFCNMTFNFLMQKLGKEYDQNGDTARKGKANSDLLNIFQNLEYYKLPSPKSIGREQFEEEIIPILENSDLSISDKLATWLEHISTQIASELDKAQGKVLFTGGGVFNEYLMQSIKNKTNAEVVIPSQQLIEFKEALIFAFLGVLRLEGENNVLSSVTGAERDHCSGTVI